MLRLRSDEDFNGNVVAGVRRHYPEIDLVRVQDVGLAGHTDSEILASAAEQAREATATGDLVNMLIHS
jgi:hypothetical protein